MGLSQLIVLSLAVIFVASPIVLSLTSLQNKMILSQLGFSLTTDNHVVLLGIFNALLIVAGLIFWESQNKDTRFLNQELAKQIKTTVQEIKQKQK